MSAIITAICGYNNLPNDDQASRIRKTSRTTPTRTTVTTGIDHQPRCQTTLKRRQFSRGANEIVWLRRSSASRTDRQNRHGRQHFDEEYSTVARKRRQSASVHKGRALYFTGGGEVLSLVPDHAFSLPSVNFTVELWLRPEGGQPADVSIVELQDLCRPNSTATWSLGIHSIEAQGHGQKSNAVFYFRLKSDRPGSPTITIDSDRRYTPARWSHVAATYNGQQVALYVDGARTAATSGLSQGALFADSLAECKTITIGGHDKSYFRGAMHRLRIRDVFLAHSDVIKSMRGQLHDDDRFSESDDVISGRVVRRDAAWRRPGDVKSPGHVTILSSRDLAAAGGADVPHPVVPPCGRTVCDDPEVMGTYVFGRRTRKRTIRYRIVNVMNDDGSDSIVSHEQIRNQDAVLRAAFKPYNISWRLDGVLAIRNDSLRARTVLYGCDPDTVGDGLCQLACNHSATGYDGGDCLTDVTAASECRSRDIGNGVCDTACNTPSSGWDAGDCCRPDRIHDCLDPTSPYRRYMSIMEYKKDINLPNEKAVNVYFADWIQEDTIGVATFPWDKDVYTIYGGVVVRPDTFGMPNKSLNLVHEFGHVLGLLHVHVGVSEMDCDDQCRETEASLFLGDLCSDTEPTPAHSHCGDPDHTDLQDQTCGVKEFKNTPYKNYMSYTGDGCANHFTKQQAARMHCYIDLTYAQWTSSRTPGPISLPPQLIRSTEDSVTISWSEPLGRVSSADDCGRCLDDYSLVQYANQSVSYVALDFGDFGPQEATGPPDGDTCSSSPFSSYSWVPYGADGPCLGDQCTIRLYLQQPVIVTRLSVWFSYVEEHSIESIDLVRFDGSVLSLRHVPAYCDMPFTAEILGETLEVVQIVIRGRNAGFAVDSVAVRSEENDVVCKQCAQLRYHVSRKPPLTGNQTTVITEDMSYTDSTVQYNTTYTYSVRAAFGTHVQRTESPILRYTHGQTYCGDGQVNSEEQCDDGNHRNGDGCSRDCRTEDAYNCRGSPSLCYRYYGDGICEDFELSAMNSLPDCGHVTPPGYKDNWMNSAAVFGADHPDHSPAGPCSLSLLTGPPKPGPFCNSKHNKSLSWRYECLMESDQTMERKYSVELEPAEPVFTSAVVLYLGTDMTSLRQDETLPVLVSVSLIYTDSQTAESIYSGLLNVSCTTTGMVLTVRHDLDKAPTKTKGVRLEFDSANLDIYAVALRSADWLEHALRSGCHGDSYYDATRHQCVTNDVVCEESSCTQPAVKHADVICMGYAEGRRCEVLCKSGYKLVGEDQHLTCANATWSGDVRCVPVDCGMPRIPYGIIDCPDGTTVGKRCKFDCMSPARKQGKSHVLFCRADGYWSLPEGYCRVFCSPLTRVKNATLLSTECASGTQQLGTVCRLRCEKGFKVKDEPEIKRTYGLQCTADGRWQGGSCERIKCTPLPKVYTGTYSCTDGFNTGSTCTIKCPGPNGVISHLKCLRSGEWNKVPEACPSDHVTCPAVPTHVVGGISADCDDVRPGSTCELTCQYPGHDIVDVTLSDWDDVSSRSVSVLCTYSGDWTPNLTDVKCLPKCEKFFIGDGYCDPNNNQARCQWDGGDCCPSTSPSGFVTSCGPGCMCKNPDAIENADVFNRARRHHARMSARVRHSSRQRTNGRKSRKS